MNKLQTLSRRHFVKTAALAASASMLPLARPLAAEGKRFPVGCRDLHLKVAGKADSWASMKALGAEVTEVNVEMDLTCPNLFHPDRKYTLATKEGIQALKDDLAANGCRISAFMMANRFDERLEQELECARRLVEAGRQLDVNAIRIDVVARAIEGEKFLPFAIQTCKRLCQLAEGSAVRFGVENHGKTANDPEFLTRLFDGVGSPKLGLTLDCANFYWWGHPLNDLYSIYERFASRVFHTHCKSIHYPADQRNVKRPMGWEYAKYNCPIYEGDLDFKKIVGILRRANYAGDLCVEDESLERFPQAERADILRKEISLLKELRG